MGGMDIRRGCQKATMELMEELQIIKAAADQPYHKKTPLDYTKLLVDYYEVLADNEKKFILLQNILISLDDLTMRDRWFLWDENLKRIIHDDYQIHESTIWKWSCHFTENADGRIISCPVLCELWRTRTLKDNNNNSSLHSDHCTCHQAA